jgi:signal transduction histidine kinase/response regulator RpfG family c-di-GMP phosphodiesterase
MLAWRNLSSLVDAAGQENRQSKLITLKEIANDLSDADNSVHAYVLVKDDNYLRPFYEAVGSIDGKLDRLYRDCKGDPKQVRLVDSLGILVGRRFDILRDFLNLDDDKRIVQSLQQIAEKLEVNKKTINTGGSAAPSVEDQEERKSGIIRKIFGRKDETNDQRSVPVDVPVHEKVVDVKDMQGTLVKVKKDQLKKLEENKAQELQFTRQDNEVSDRVTALITAFEKLELDRNDALAEATNQKMRETNRSITMVCALLGLLILLMSWVILRYVRKSRAYTVGLRKAKTEAEELARMKENFLASMSHEMRTPMNAIAGFTEQLQQTELDDEQKRQLEIIRNSTEHLVEILNDVLDYSKLQAGKIKLQPVAFRPAILLKEVTQLVAPVAEKKKLALHHEVHEQVPEVIRCDELRLKQILLNLAGNAVKFTEKGEVRLRASVRREGPTSLLAVCVSDTGIGIPANKLEKIFEEFEQADEHITNKYGGTGLGLSITKKLVELQNGSIEIESEPGKGTTITVAVPFTPATISEEPVVTEQEMDTTLLKGKNVLVVDDEEYNRLLLIAILKKWGVRYEEAANGIEAIEELSTGSFDAVLMDVRMPVLDGVETVKRIRKLEGRLGEVPSVAVTAAASPADVKRCKEAGFDEVLSKPFKEMELYHLLASVMDIEGTGQVKSVRTAPKKTGKRYDLDELRRLAAGDEKFFTDMIKTFIDSTADGVMHIMAHTKTRNWEQVAHYSHKIAAPCRHMGAETLLRLLQKIEVLARKNEKSVEEIPQLSEKLSEESKILLDELKNELDRTKV